MRNAAVRGLALCLAGLLPGCAAFESLTNLFTDDAMPVAMGQPTPVAQIMPAAAVAPAPAFHVGDVFRFRVGESLIAESVERVDGQGVWWRDSLGRRWIGGEPALIPGRAVFDAGGKPQVASVVMEATGDMFPLTPGKTVTFRHTTRGGVYAAQSRKQSCTVVKPAPAETAAGTFDTILLECIYDGVRRNNYYSPALGRVVLQTADTFLDPVKRELVSFERGSDEPMRTAQGGGASNNARAAYSAEGAELYGIQLAAYRSPTRAKQAWTRIRSAGGALLAEFEPSFEQGTVKGTPLFRLIVGEFETKAQARARCQSLKRNGIDCWARERQPDTSSPVAATPATDLRVVQR